MAASPDAATRVPKRSFGLTIVKIVLGLAILACLWGFVFRDTKLDPVRQVSAAIHAIVHPEGPIDLPSLASHVTNGAERTSYVKAVAKLDERKYYAAARDLTKLATKYPTITPALGRYYVNVGADLLKEGEYRKANECLRIAVDYFVPQSGRAHLLLAESYDGINQSDEANRHRKKARTFETERPNDPFDSLYLALSLGLTLVASLALGGIFSVIFGSQARASDAQATESGEIPTFWNAPDTTGEDLEPSDGESKYGSITKVLTAEERLDQVKLLFEEGLYEDSYEIFRKAASLNPAVSKKVAKMCLEEGIRLYELESLQKAAELFEVSLQHDPHSLHGHTYLANCCIKLDRFDKAVEHYLAVVRINPDNATGYYNLGICYHKTGDVQNALRAFDVSTQKEELPNAHFYLAKIHESMGNKVAAIKHWKRCHELAPDTPQGTRAQERLNAITEKP